MEIRENVPLKDYSNYKIGGPARFFAIAGNEEEVREGVSFAKDKGLPLFILGGGTNLLLPDEGYPGLVLVPKITTLLRSGNRIEVGAGVQVSDLLNFAIAEQISGLEWAGGLPGMVGGAIRGNAGAFGGEIKDNLIEAVSFDTQTMNVVRRGNEDCNFSYRNSIFKEKDGQEIILSATFEMTPGDPEEIRTATQARIDRRKEKHPLEYPNIGSIFKNVPVENIPEQSEKELVYNIKIDPIPVIPTARIIDKAGLKGERRGGAQISEKHTNFIVNTGGATAKDVAALMELIKSRVFERFGVKLEEEVERLDLKIKHQESARI